MSQTTDYYDLPTGKRWITDGSPEEIGGRSTDITQIGMSLARTIREMYPVNGVPLEIAASLTDLELLLERAEEQIHGVIALVTEDVSK